MTTETCNKCGEKFSVSKIGGGVPGGKDKEPVICPYCNHTVRTEMTSACFLTGKIDTESKS